jgi:hypothetical protein
MRLAIGCPIYNREWVIPRWWEALEAQALPPGTEVEFHFAVSPSEDDTERLLLERCNGRLSLLNCADLPTFPNRHKGHNAERFATLATLRNRLVESVRRSDPDYFLSVDSDMILEPNAVQEMLGVGDCVGALSDMLGSAIMVHPSAMRLEHNGVKVKAQRISVDGIGDEPLPVDVVMAVVLFSRRGYRAVHYGLHEQGEDIAAALSLRDAGVSRWLQPRARATHLFYRDT